MMALVASTLLPGCASTPSGRPAIELADPPRSLTAACARPVEVPTDQLKISAAQVERLWAEDRAALARCGWTKAKLAAFYQTQIDALEEASK